MNKHCIIIITLSLFLLVTELLASSVDKVLTVHKMSVRLKGFENEKLKGRMRFLLQRYGFSMAKRNAPVEVTFQNNVDEVTLYIENLTYQTELFAARISIYGEKYNVEKPIDTLLKSFYTKLPANKLIYEKAGNRVKINAGKRHGLKEGMVLHSFRFLGELTEDFKLKKHFARKKTGKIRLLKVGRFNSLAEIVDDIDLRKYDKLSEHFSTSSVNSSVDKTDKEITLSVGSCLGSLRSFPEAGSISQIIPDEDKTLAFKSPSPLLDLSAWYYNYGFNIEVFGRNIGLKVESGDKIKAQFLNISPSLRYRWHEWFTNYKDSFILSLGWFSYIHKVPQALVRYISTSINGPSASFIWERIQNGHGGFLNLTAYPYLKVTEDQVKRGESSRSFGFYCSGGYLFKRNKQFLPGASASLFYRWIKTKYSGATTHGISVEDQSFIESYFGVKLLLSFSMYL